MHTPTTAEPEDKPFSDAPESAQIAARFERLPFTAYQKRLALILASCFAMDAVDISMLSFLLAPISHDLGLTQIGAGIAASAVFAGVGVGAAIAGFLCDRYGRRRMLIYTMYLWGFASLLTAFSWDLWSFAILRFITGVGLGAELPAAFALIAECMPATRRATITGWMQIGASTATTLFNLLALGAVWFVGDAFGWRAMFVVMFLAALLAIYVRRHVPESPRWYEASGRHAEADVAMREFERHVEMAMQQPLPPAQPSTQQQRPPRVRSGFLDLFSHGCAKRTLFVWALWLIVMMGYFGITTWVGKLLVDRGMSVSDSIVVGVLISLAGIPAAWLTGNMMERAGRKVVIVGVLLLVSVAAFAYGSATAFVWIVLTGAIMRFFIVALATTLYVYTPELFPTHIRATGLGTASAMGRISAVAGPLVVPPLVVLFGYTGTFAAFAACFCLSAVMVLIFGPETKGKSLEDASA